MLSLKFGSSLPPAVKREMDVFVSSLRALLSVSIADDGTLYESDFGRVVQATSITTRVTLNRRAGEITTVSQTVAAGGEADFTVSNSRVLADDVVVVAIKTHTSNGSFIAAVTAVTNGSFNVRLTNLHAATAGDSVLVLSFRVLNQGA